MYRFEIHYSEKIIKLGILYFSLFTWYQSQERKPNFLGDRVSFRSPSTPPDLLLTTAAAAGHRRHCRRPPPSLPPAAAVTAAGDFPGISSLAENHRFRSAEGRSTRRWPPCRKPASHAPSRACLLRQPRHPRAGA